MQFKGTDGVLGCTMVGCKRWDSWNTCRQEGNANGGVNSDRNMSVFPKTNLWYDGIQMTASNSINGDNPHRDGYTKQHNQTQMLLICLARNYPPLPPKKKRNDDLQHVSTGLFHSSAWFYSVLVHFCSATVKRMPAEQQALQLAFLPLPARSFHGPQFHRPPPACFCARSLRCSIRLELAHTQWLTPGPHPQRRLGSLAPGGQSCHPQSPFTTRDKRHERAPSPESPLLFPGVILPRSPSTPPPPIPRKKKQENKAAKGEERGGEGRGEKNSTTPKLTVWQHVWSRPFLAFSMDPGLITDLNWGL